jgi:hypothetical protein
MDRVSRPSIPSAGVVVNQYGRRDRDDAQHPEADGHPAPHAALPYRAGREPARMMSGGGLSAHLKMKLIMFMIAVWQFAVSSAASNPPETQYSQMPDLDAAWSMAQQISRERLRC